MSRRGRGKLADIICRLAPEHAWPGPHEDMYDAVKWVSFLALTPGCEPDES